jgi:hypothetical protein
MSRAEDSRTNTNESPRERLVGDGNPSSHAWEVFRLTTFDEKSGGGVAGLLYGAPVRSTWPDSA